METELPYAWTHATLARLGVADHWLCQRLLRELAGEQALQAPGPRVIDRVVDLERAVIRRAVRQARQSGLRGQAAERYIQRRLKDWRCHHKETHPHATTP